MLTFVIPTHNRPSHLEVCVRSIADQATASVQIVILDDVSANDTVQVIAKLCAEYPFVTSHRMAEHIDYSHVFRSMFQISPNSDWVWTFGDDDKLEPGALAFMLDHLTNLPPECDFLHVAEKSRASGMNAIFNGAVMDVFCELGWIEMTGFITGNITRGRVLYEAGQSQHWRTYSKTAFVHSCALLERLRNSHMQFVDIPLIDVQDEKQTTETLERWKANNIPARYMYLSQAVEAMFEAGILTQKLPEKFFRYIGYHIWDRFITFFLADYLNQGVVWHEDWAMHIKRFADFLLDDGAAARVRADTDGARAMVTLDAALKGNRDMLNQQLNALLDARNAMPYPQGFIEAEKVGRIEIATA